MKPKMLRAVAALALVLVAGASGYAVRGDASAYEAPNIPAVTVTAPPEDSVRVIYSLDTKQADKEVIAVIDDAERSIYFAIYTFTLPSIADALVTAKERGVAVYGIVDSEQAASSYGAPIVKQLADAGIPVRTEKHASGNGIMHIKALVTEKAYVIGSYNWTKSATTINDEIIEIGTDPALRRAYENILKRLFEAYKGTDAAAGAAASISTGTYDYKDAIKHIGEYASVRGTLVSTYISKTGTLFLDFCASYKTCPFTGVIFADDVENFENISDYEGDVVTLTGKIQLYEGKAEIILKNPSQISK